MASCSTYPKDLTPFLAIFILCMKEKGLIFFVTDLKVIFQKEWGQLSCFLPKTNKKEDFY